MKNSNPTSKIIYKMQPKEKFAAKIDIDKKSHTYVIFMAIKQSELSFPLCNITANVITREKGM